jgi:hypothetical protein
MHACCIVFSEVRIVPRPIRCAKAERADLGGGWRDAHRLASKSVVRATRLRDSLGGNCLRALGDMASFEAVEYNLL